MKMNGKTLAMAAAMLAGSLGCEPSSTELANEQATLTISPTAAQVEIGDEVSLTSIVSVNGNSVARDRTWEATNPSVAELVWSPRGPENGSGRVFGKAVGTAVVTVKYKDQSASATVTVVPAKPWTVTISPRDLALEVGSQTQLSAHVQNSSGATKIAVPVAWTTDNAAIATVTPLQTGGVTLLAKAPGTVHITATVVGSPGGSGTATYTVVGGTKAATLTLSPSSLELSLGQPGSFTCIARNDVGEALNIGLLWTSSDNSVATVNNGAITPVKPGQTVITCREPNSGLSQTAVVTVKAPAAQGCWPVPSAVTFKVAKISDPGGFDGTITLGNAGQITVNVSATATPGKIQIVGGGKMNGWNVDKVDVNGSAPSTSNACAIDLNEGAVFFGPGNHKTRLVGNASVTPGTKLRLQFLNFNTGALETEYELEVVSVN